jgi:hypothetical protein
LQGVIHNLKDIHMSVSEIKSGSRQNVQVSNLEFAKLIAEGKLGDTKKLRNKFNGTKCLYLDGTPKCKVPEDRFYNYDLNPRKAGDVTREQLLKSTKKASYYCNYIVTKEPHSLGRWLDLLSVGSYESLENIKNIAADASKNSSKWDSATIAKKFNELNGSVDSCGYAAIGLVNAIKDIDLNWRITPGQ